MTAGPGLSPGLGLRGLSALFVGAAFTLLLFSLPALFGYVGLFISGGLIAVAQLPLAIGGAVTGLRLRDAGLPTPWVGPALAALCGLYAGGLVAAFGVGALVDQQLEGGLLVALATVACGGPLVLLGVSVIARHAQVGVVARPARLGAWAGGVAIAAGALSLALLAMGGAVEDAVAWVWLAAPTVVAGGAAWALWRRTRAHALEDALRAALPPGMVLDQSVLPVRVRCVVPIVDGIDVTRAGTGDTTPLGNPVLDHALPLRTSDPDALARRLQGHEGTALAVLHAWPLARLEPGAVVWEAEPDQLQAALAGEGALIPLLTRCVQDAERLAQVLGRAR